LDGVGSGVGEGVGEVVGAGEALGAGDAAGASFAAVAKFGRALTSAAAAKAATVTVKFANDVDGAMIFIPRIVNETTGLSNSLVGCFYRRD
jgi:hypothetical protein